MFYQTNDIKEEETYESKMDVEFLLLHQMMTFCRNKCLNIMFIQINIRKKKLKYAPGSGKLYGPADLASLVYVSRNNGADAA